MKRYKIILVLMVLCLIGGCALAEEEYYYYYYPQEDRIVKREVIQNGKYKYIILDNGTIEIVDYLWDSGDVEKTIMVPSVLDGKTVTSIGERAFSDHYISWQVKIVLPETLVSIVDSAFGVNGITAVEFSGEKLYIGQYAFSMMQGLEYISLEASELFVSKSAFSWCEKLKEVYIPEGKCYIDSNAFGLCYELYKVEFPEDTVLLNQNRLDQNIFSDCGNLEKLIVGNEEITMEYENLKQFYAPAGVDFSVEEFFNLDKGQRVEAEWAKKQMGEEVEEEDLSWLLD